MEEQRYRRQAAAASRSRSRGRRKNKVKSMIHNVGFQIRKVAKGKNDEGYYSDDHNQDPAVIEYSLSRYQKNLVKQQKKLQKEQKVSSQQRRDDDELNDYQSVSDITRNSSTVYEDKRDGSTVATDSLFSPFECMFPLAALQDEDINEGENQSLNEHDDPNYDGDDDDDDDNDNDDCREAEGEEDCQADPEREQHPENDQDNGGILHSSAENKDEQDEDKQDEPTEAADSLISPFECMFPLAALQHNDTKEGEIQSLTENGDNDCGDNASSMTAKEAPHETEVPIAESKTTEKASKSTREPSSSSPRRRRSSRAFVAGAKKVTKMPGKFVRSSSKLIFSNAKKVTRGLQKNSKTSKELSSSVRRMVDANQKKAATGLLLSVRSMMQKQEDYKTPGLLLDSVKTLIRDTETNATRKQKIACRARRRNYREKKLIEYKVQSGQGPDDEILRQKNVEQLRSNPKADQPGTVVVGNYSMVRSMSSDESVVSASTSAFHSEYDSEIEGGEEEEDHYSCEDDLVSGTDWDNRTIHSETSAYTTDLNNSKYFDEESDIEIEGPTLYGGFTPDDIVSERSEDEDDSSEIGYTTGGSVKTITNAYAAEYADTDVIDDDSSCFLSERDQAIFDQLEKELKQLEDMHENERESMLFRTFYPED